MTIGPVEIRFSLIRAMWVAVISIPAIVLIYGGYLPAWTAIPSAFAAGLISGALTPDDAP